LPGGGLPFGQEETDLTTTPDAPKADASPALVVDEAKRAARPARSPEAIDRYIAEERASWDEHDRRIEQCHREAMAQSPPPEREWGQAGGPANTVGERSDPAMRSSVRTIGRRTEPPAGVLRAPTPEEQDWVRRMSGYRTRVPKGIFRYRSAEEANADWDRWRAALLAEGTGIERFVDGR